MQQTASGQAQKRYGTGRHRGVGAGCGQLDMEVVEYGLDCCDHHVWNRRLLLGRGSGQSCYKAGEAE